MELLRRCGLRKSKGIPLWSILSYIFSNVFRDRSMYMQQKSGKCTAGFSKNTYYRFMQNPHINWLRLTILLAERIVNGHLKDLTSDQRAAEISGLFRQVLCRRRGLRQVRHNQGTEKKRPGRTARCRLQNLRHHRRCGPLTAEKTLSERQRDSAVI